MLKFRWAALAAAAALAGCGGGGQQQPGAPPPGQQANTGDGGDIILTRDAAIGAKYGAPGPRTCSTYKTPAKGPPTADQIAKYVICYTEQEHSTSANLTLVDQVQITDISGGRPYNPNEDVNMGRIDTTAPIYDIRGSLMQYSCNQIVQPGGYDGGPDWHPGTQCRSSAEPQARGVCYQTALHEWYCNIVDIAGIENSQNGVAPPPAD